MILADSYEAILVGTQSAKRDCIAIYQAQEGDSVRLDDVTDANANLLSAVQQLFKLQAEYRALTKAS